MIPTPWLIFAIILFISTAVAITLASILIYRIQKPGIRSIFATLASLAVWSFGYAMTVIMPSEADKLFWLRVENVGIQLAPVFWFVFSFKYAHNDQWLTGKPIMLAFYFIPIASLACVFSDTFFHLYYTSTKVATPTGGPFIISRGPMYWVTLVYSYSLYTFGLIVLIRRFLRLRRFYRRQMPYLIAAVLIPFSLNILYQVAPEVLPLLPAPVDLTPLAFTITAVLLVVGIFGFHSIDVVPIARDTVMEHIPEMVFVLDEKDRIIDANAVAQKWLGKPLQEISGREPIEVFEKWPQLLQRFFFLEEARDEIEIPGDPPRILETIITPIHNRQQKIEGRVILAYDITDRKNLEKELKRTNETLQEQLDENERLRLQLQEQAIRDPLTGVFNRRYFAEALDNETARSIREKVPFSLIILDVDHFKKTNDTYGHKCGDVVLRSLAEFLLQHTRRSDIVCRFGGEEFVILMPDASVESAKERAEFFRREFMQHVHQCGELEIKSTFSAGVASFPIHSDSGEILLGLADQALYESKEAGRNRVTVYSPTTAISNAKS
ncbi:MAG: diguanylate cyclase [Anaerolineales bacterium]|nr:diguanylate cyclase [Anaerolineales bacterium]MCB9146994.1 diguanylate cyclase [Anaerolineales bacterium]